MNMNIDTKNSDFELDLLLESLGEDLDFDSLLGINEHLMDCAKEYLAVKNFEKSYVDVTGAGKVMIDSYVEDEICDGVSFYYDGYEDEEEMIETFKNLFNYISDIDEQTYKYAYEWKDSYKTFKEKYNVKNYSDFIIAFLLYDTATESFNRMINNKYEYAVLDFVEDILIIGKEDDNELVFLAREEIKKKLIIPEYNDVFEELLKETYEYNYKENDYDVLLSNFIDKNEDRLKRLKDELTLRVLKILKDFSDKLLDNHKEKYALKA